MAYPNIKFKTFTDIVDKDGDNVISYNDSSSTIDFNNKNVINFTGGGSGSGDASLSANQTFSGVNTFSNNTIMGDISTANITAVGAIGASGNLTGQNCIVTGGVQCNTGTLECNDCEVTNNCTIASGNLVVTAGTGLIGGNLTTNGIANTGSISTGTLSSTGNLTLGGDCDVAGEIIGNNGFVINSGTSRVLALNTNNITTTGTIACNSQIQGASLSAAAGDITAVAGNINGLSLQSNGGQVLLKTGNARIESDVNDDTRIQANTNTDTIVCRLGATGADNLQLSYDSGTNKSVLKLYDFAAGQYYNVGGSPDDLLGLIASLQNTSLTFNPTTTGTFQGGLVGTGTATFSGTVVNLGTGSNTSTITAMNDTADRLNVNAGKIQLDATATLSKTGTSSGATDLFTSVDTCLDRSAPTWVPTVFTLVTTTPTAGEVQLDGTITNHVQSSIQAVQFGVNGSTPVYRVSCRGRLTGFSVNQAGGSINLFTLPAGYRPTVEQNYIAMGHPDEKQVRIDISTAGLVSIAQNASSASAAFCNLGGISFWAGV